MLLKIALKYVSLRMVLDLLNHQIFRDVRHRHRATTSGLHLAMHCYWLTKLHHWTFPSFSTSTLIRFSTIVHDSVSGHTIRCMTWYPRHQRIFFINPTAESLLQLPPQDPRQSLDFTNTDLCKAICLMIPFWRRHQHQLDTCQVARSTKLNSCRSVLYLTRILLNPRLLMNAVWRSLPVNNCRSHASNWTFPTLDTQDRQHIPSVTTKEAIIAANFMQLSTLSWGCGEVEDVVGVLTPVGSGVSQVFHDLLVELRLLLVAEVE